MDVEIEQEIKIEYFDNLSSDPLADNCENTIKDTVGEGKIKDAEGDTENYFGDEDIIDYSCLPKRVTVNWYKEIDSTGRYLCRYCDLKYSSIQTLRFHVRRKHFYEAKKIKNTITNNKRRNKIKCHICNEKFQCLKDLKVHFDAQHCTEYLNMSCFYCDATFANEDEVTEHQLNVHSVIKKSKFLCTTCGYRTSKKSHFNQHQNTHLSQKKLKCKYCDYSTNYLPNLNDHERIHTNTKPYKCDYRDCSYSCVVKSALWSHKLKHFPDENMLYCDKCSYKTVYRQSLRKHQESHIRNKIGFRII